MESNQLGLIYSYFILRKSKQVSLTPIYRLEKVSEIPVSHEDSWRHVRPSFTDLLPRELVKEGLKGETLGNPTKENTSSTGEATVHQDPVAASPVPTGTSVTIKSGKLTYQ